MEKNITQPKIFMSDAEIKIFNFQNDNEWLNLVIDFEDLNLLQTLSFNKGSLNWKDYEIAVLISGKTIKSAAVIRIKKIPFLGNIGYISWGPLWKKFQTSIPTTDNFENLFLFLKHLKSEYVYNKGFFLIIKPNIIKSDLKAAQIFNNLGYKKVNQSNFRRTLLIDLEQPFEEIKSNFRAKWLSYLNKTLKKNLVIKYGFDDTLFDEFIKLYNLMKERKSFKESVDVYATKKINDDLPDQYKFRIIICYKEANPLAAVVLSFFGNTVTYYLGASSKEGLKEGAPYLLQWEAIKWSKNNGAKWYDLGGIDPITNPGGYLFKSGLSKLEVQHTSPYIIYKNNLSNRLIKIIFNTISYIK